MTYKAATQWNPARSKLLLGVVLAPGEIGKRIKAAREKRGWTQIVFSREANVSPSTVARWEAGKLPPIRELIRVAEILGVETEYLVEPDEVNDDVDRRLDRVDQRLEGVERLLRDILGRLERPAHEL